MFLLALGYFLINRCMGDNHISIKESEIKEFENFPYHFISIELPRITSRTAVIFFQLCFIPNFPIEMPDEFWNTGYSNCYIKQKPEDVPKYTAIGIPLRLGPQEFIQNILPSSLLYGNGIFEIEHFERDYDSEKYTLIVRNTILLAGKFVAHLFEVEVTYPGFIKISSDWAHVKDSKIKTLNYSKLIIKPKQQYCYLMPKAPEDNLLMPSFEDTSYIKFLCDICWFDYTVPNFSVRFHCTLIIICSDFMYINVYFQSK